MRQIVKWLVTIGLASGSLQAFENAQMSLDTPLLLDAGESTFAVRHRFYGPIDDAEKFFGMDDGGNIMLQLRYVPVKHLFVEVDHTRDGSEYAGALGASYDFGMASAQAKVEGFSLKLGASDDRVSNLFGNVALQTTKLFDHLIVTVNGGYDGYYQHTGAGFGADLVFDNFIPSLTFTETIALLGEYYPVFDKIDNVTGKHDSYAAGVRFRTYGHHFEVLVSNATAMKARTMMLGTDRNTVHFGFNINRKF